MLDEYGTSLVPYEWASLTHNNIATAVLNRYNNLKSEPDP